MHRRDVVRSLAAVAALPFVPRGAESAAEFGHAIHARLGQQGFRTLNGPQQRLVSELSDRIIPPTGTPGAVDVGVPGFIDLLLTEWHDPADRDAFLAGLAAIDERAREEGGSAFVDLSEAQKLSVMRLLDASRTDGAGRTFADLKSLTVYGYFTSERVSKEVLQPQIFFAEFDGCAPVTG
jgi:gluconate 2-dehydrogenase gamma chain